MAERGELMENRIIELFEENFGFAFKATAYNNMIVAIRTFEQFKKKNEDFFSFEKRETVFGHLRTYAIERQFNDSAFNPRANYAVSMKQVNSYKHKALCIETKDFIVNLGRTNGAFKLLPQSSYKKDFAKSNAGISMQLSFDLSGEYPVVVESKKYAQITYGYKFGDMTHLSIVLPSDNYSGSEYTVNLLADVNVYKNYVPEELVEESIVALKKNLSDEIEKII